MEFNWTYDPNAAASKAGEIFNQLYLKGDPNGNFLLLNIESSRNSPVPVKKGGVGNWVYDTAFFESKVTGVTGVDDVYISRKIGSTPSVTGQTISDSNAFPSLQLAGVMGSIYGDERGGRIA